MNIHIIFWIIFAVLVGIMFYIDLYVTDHEHGEKSLKSATIWSAIWILVALLFNVALYFFYDQSHQSAFEFLAGYLIEKSLSIDNLFVFVMIFSTLSISKRNQPHILKWGILSAIVFRIIFIFLGVNLIEHFKFTIVIFGLILLYASYKMLAEALSKKEKKMDLDKNVLIKYVKKHFNLVTDYHGEKFFTRIDKKTYITPLFLAFLLIESADIVFAVDSIPAVLAITHDPFIVITSNIFAILGLRALYFVLAGMLSKFEYLKIGVSVLLFYVAIKMLASEYYKIPTDISLIIIIGILIASVIPSFIKKKKNA